MKHVLVITMIILIVVHIFDILSKRISFNKLSKRIKALEDRDEQDGFYDDLMNEIPNTQEDKKGYTWELIGILDENIVATYDNIVGELTIDDLFAKYDFIGDRDHYRLNRIGLTVEENNQ